MKKNYLISKLLLLFTLLLGAQSLSAQQLSVIYSFSQYQGTYTPITGGQVVGVAPTMTENWTSPAITVPAVTIAGTSYTTAYVTSNGILKFGGTAPSTSLYLPISNTPVGGGIHISAFANDLDLTYANSNSELRYQEVGNELVFQWKGFKRYGFTEEFDLQVRINRLTSKITFVYNLLSTANSSTARQPQVGIALSTTNYVSREVADNATSSWLTSTASTVNTATCRFTSATSNPKAFTSGLHYEYTYMPCSLPNPGVTTATGNTNVCYGNPVTLSVSNTLPTFGYYLYALMGSNDNIQYTEITNGNTIPYTTIANYKYYRFRLICPETTDTVYSTPVAINYNSSITSKTDANICGLGSATLSVVSNGTSVDWYAQPTGGTVLATGNSFTTPVINATTTYYAAPKKNAVSNVLIGAGATTSATYPNPFYSNWANSHNQYLITAAELTAAGLVAGNINSIGITVNSGTTTLNNVNLKIAATTATTLTAFLAPTFTDVYAAASYTPTLGLNTFVFTTPYAWDGTSNILLDWCFDNLTSVATISNTCLADNTSYNSTIHVNRTSTNNTLVCGNTTTGLTTYTVRPRFTINGLSSLCYGSREPVTVNVSAPSPLQISNDESICNNAIKELSVTTGTANYNQVTWAPVANLYTDAAATIPYVANAHAYTVYLKSNTESNVRIVARGTNTVTQCSNSDTVNIYVLPSQIAAVANTGSFCNSGSTTIGLAQPLLGSNVTFQWQNSSDNVTFADISGATANTYTTPTLSATTYYRIVVKNSSNATCLTSISDTVYVSTPMILTSVNDTLCGSNAGQLAATANANSMVRWFSSLTASVPLATGNTYTTPIINTTTDYYASPYSITNGVVSIGTGTSTGSSSPYSPVSGSYGGMKAQYILTAQELTDAGLFAGPITGISFEITTAGTSTYNDFSIEMGTTTLNEFPTPVDFLGGLTLVKTPANLTPVVGNANFDFTTPFNWDGVSNIIVSTSWSNNASTSSGSSVRYSSVGSYRAQGTKRDNVTSAVMLATVGNIGATSRDVLRPNFKLKGNAVCEGPRVVVKAVVNPAPTFEVTANGTVCNNTVKTIAMTQGTTSYNRVTWSPAANLFTDAAATVPYTANANATTVYFKATAAGEHTYVATAYNTTSECQSFDTITVTNLPATIAVAAVGSRNYCVTGSTTLELQGNPILGSATIQWQQSDNNTLFTNIAGATGTTYTTPAITATKYYRVQLVLAGNTCVTTSVADTVVISNPSLSTVVGGSNCGPDSFLLSATPTNSNHLVKWYSSLSSTTPLFEGPSFQTPYITGTETYYAAAVSSVAGEVIISNDTHRTISTSTAFSPVSPYAHHYGNYKHHILILASELNAMGVGAGNITSLGFDVASVGSTPGTFNNFGVSLMHTTQTALTVNFQMTGGQQVFSGNVTPTVGVNTYTFSAPFVWDGVSNIIVQTCYNNNNSGAVARSAEVFYDSTSFISHSIWRLDGTQNAACDATVANASNGGPIMNVRPKMYLNANLSCEGSRMPVVATVLPVIEAEVTPNGNVGLCNGSNRVLTSVNTASNYVWLRNNTPIASSNSNVLNVTDTGSYRLVTIEGTCTDTSDVVFVAYSPNPTVTLVSDYSICPGTSTTLDIGATNNTVLWDDNSTLTTRNITAPGRYHVTVTNGFGCKAADTINIGLFPAAIPQLGNDTAKCSVHTLVLNPGSYDSYIWNNNTTTSTLPITDSGYYFVTVTDNNGCIGSDTIHVSFLEEASVEGFNFVPYFYEQQGKVQFNAINPQFVSNYLWEFGDGTTSTLRNPVHVYQTNGLFDVKLSVWNSSCPSSLFEQQISIDFRGTSVDEINNALNAKLYPNPSHHKVNIEFSKTDVQVKTVKIMDMTGRWIPAEFVSKQNVLILDVNQLTSGMYHVQVETNYGIYTTKFDVIK